MYVSTQSVKKKCVIGIKKNKGLKQSMRVRDFHDIYTACNNDHDPILNRMRK